MTNREFLELLQSVKRMTSKQRKSLARVLAEEGPPARAQRNAEGCPRCGDEHVVRWGTSRGKQRWKCRGCDRTFGALTNTPLSGLWYEEVWPEFLEALKDGAVLREISERCGISMGTAHRWRTRFLEALVAEQEPLGGIAEADETYLRRSAKGQPDERERLGRPARKRGKGVVGVGWPEQVPVFMARDRGGSIVGRVCDRQFNRDAATELLSDVLAPDSILCTDGHRAYLGAAKDLGVKHERLLSRSGQRVRGPFHVQNVNNLHSRFKGWMRRFRGVSTRRLPFYVAWFNRVVNAPSDRRDANRLIHHILDTAPT